MACACAPAAGGARRASRKRRDSGRAGIIASARASGATPPARNTTGHSKLAATAPATAAP